MAEKRTLKVAFAMGGGVSLGTFQGASLAEALKLLILRGGYEDGPGNWQRYERIEVDVFSGASAGSLSLALMLRTLVKPELGGISKQQAEDELRKQFGNTEIDALNAEALDDLIAAQIVQMVQEKVWVEEISMDQLLADFDRPAGELRYSAGIVNRAAVDDIAKRYFKFEGELEPEREILGDRVLFASSLSNVTATLADARGEFDSSGGDSSTKDGLTSKMHRELRLFDIHFNDMSHVLPTPESVDKDRHPERWLRCHFGDEVPGVMADMRLPKSWARVAATSIASGAFPLAFEPVPLERYWFEYGTDQNGQSYWPKTIPAGTQKFTFTFFDGGTFNNEPIREAFRMSAFMDANARAKGDRNFDRIVIFSDPAVDDQPSSLNVGIHGQFGLADPDFRGEWLDGYDLFRKSSLDRLIPHIFTLISAIHNESRNVEGDKVYRVRKKFEIRDNLRAIIPGLTTSTPDRAVIDLVTSECESMLKSNRSSQMIPPGMLDLGNEMKRVASEIAGSDLKAKYEPVPTSGAIEKFINDHDAIEDGDMRRSLFQLLVAVCVDLIMDLEGKVEGVKLAGISPMDIDTQKPFPLPGAAASAFAGFMSPLAGRYEVEVAKYCARRRLEKSGVIKQKSGSKPSKPKPFKKMPEYSAFQGQVRLGLQELGKRIGQLIADSQLPFSKPLQMLLQGRINSALVEMMEDEKPVTHEFHLIVPNKKYEIDGRGFPPVEKDVRARFIEGHWTLITFADWYPVKGRWEGAYVKSENGKATIQVDRDGTFRDKGVCLFAMPDAAMISRTSLYPHPVFVAKVEEKEGGKDLKFTGWSLGVKKLVPLEKTLFE